MVTDDEPPANPPPHLVWDQLQNRVPLVLPYWDGSEWWIYGKGVGPNEIVRIDGIPGDELLYVARDAAGRSDFHLRFMELMYQRAYWPQIARFIEAIVDDVRNMGVVLAKLDHFYEQRAAIGSVVCRFVETELEYLVGLCRSVFDLLHDILAAMWPAIRFPDGYVKQNLPGHMSKIMLDGRRLRGAQEIDAKWKLGPPLAHFYSHHASFFSQLREYRDNIYHRGHAFHIVRLEPRGFSIDAEAEPFASLGVWTDAHRSADGHASLRPALAEVLLKTILACETFAIALRDTAPLPPEVAPGLQVFFRSPHGVLLKTLKDVKEEKPWWGD